MMSDAAEEALAHAHISSLLSLYYQALDRGDFDTLERQVMAEDAVWEVVEHASNGRVEDRAEGRDRVIAWFKRMLSGDVAMNHGTRARSTSHLQCVDCDTMATLANGFAEAEHVKTPQGWRILRYKIEERITDADMTAFKAALELEYE